MYVEIVTPEAVLFKGKVATVTVPSTKGAFQMLENHAPVIAVLGKGVVQIKGIDQTEIFIESFFEQVLEGEYSLFVKGGIIEQKENRTIILVER